MWFSVFSFLPFGKSTSLHFDPFFTWKVGDSRHSPGLSWQKLKFSMVQAWLASRSWISVLLHELHEFPLGVTVMEAIILINHQVSWTNMKTLNVDTDNTRKGLKIQIINLFIDPALQVSVRENIKQFHTIFVIKEYFGLELKFETWLRVSDVRSMRSIETQFFTMLPCGISIITMFISALGRALYGQCGNTQLRISETPEHSGTRPFQHRSSNR